MGSPAEGRDSRHHSAHFHKSVAPVPQPVALSILPPQVGTANSGAAPRVHHIEYRQFPQGVPSPRPACSIPVTPQVGGSACCACGPVGPRLGPAVTDR